MSKMSILLRSFTSSNQVLTMIMAVLMPALVAAQSPPVITLTVGANSYTANTTTVIENGQSTTPGAAGVGNATTNEGTLTYSDSLSAGSCPTAFVTTRTWSATSSNGTTTLIQTINQNDTTAPAINSGSLTLSQSINLSSACTSTVPDLRAAVRAASSDVTTSTAQLTVTQSPAEGSAISARGPVSVVVTVKDKCLNTNTVTYTITYDDVTAPSISGPADVSNIFVDNGACTASGVSLGTPTTSDTCGMSATPYTNDAPASFPYGSTT